MLNRRTLIAVGATAPIAITATAPSAALFIPTAADAGNVGTQILSLFREYQSILKAAGEHAYTGAFEDEDLEKEELFYKRSDLLREKMLTLPSTSAADFAAKMIMETCKGELFPDWRTGEVWIEARVLTGGAA